MEKAERNAYGNEFLGKSEECRNVWDNLVALISRGDGDNLEKVLKLSTHKACCKYPTDTLLYIIFEELCDENEKGEMCLKLLLKYGAIDTNSRDNEGFTPLGYYLILGQPSLAKILMEHGCKIKDCEKPDGYGVLYTIADNENADEFCGDNYYECTEMYLQNGGKVNSTTSSGVTPLMKAAEGGFWELVELLLKYKAEINAVDNVGNSPMKYLLKTEEEIEPYHLECLINLFNAGARCQGENVELWSKFLRNAAYFGRLQDMQFLVERGADVNCAERSGDTSLHYLFRNPNPCPGDVECAKYLMSQGANIDHANKEGETPFMAVLACGNQVFLEFALNHGTAKMKSKDGSTTLHLLAHGYVSRKAHIECAEVLINKGVKVNAINAKGHTALMLAAERGHIGLVKLLASKGGQFHTLDTHKRSALHLIGNVFFCTPGHVDCAKLLIKKKVSAYKKDMNCKTPLFLACQGGHYELVELFLENTGSERLSDEILRNINIAGINSKEIVECVDMVVKHDSKLECSEYSSETAISLACEMGMPKILNTLLDHCKQYCDKDQKFPLHHLGKYRKLSRSQLECADIILKKCPNSCNSNNSGQTPLIIASKNRNSSLIQLLVKKVPRLIASEICKLLYEGHDQIVSDILKAGVPPDLESENKMTPIAIAAQISNVQMVDMLLKYGSVVGSKSKFAANKIVLCITVKPPSITLEQSENRASEERYDVEMANKQKAKCAKILIGAGASVNVKSSNGQTLLMHAILGQNRPMFDLLLQNVLESELKATDKEGLSVLHCVSESYKQYVNPQLCMKFAKDLIRRGAVYIDGVNKDKKSPLALAAEVGFQRFVYLLLLCNANPDAADQMGNTALHTMASQPVNSDHLCCAEKLLQFGASPYLRNKSGHSALSLAHNNKNKELKSLLEKQQMPVSLKVLSRRAVCGCIRQPVWENLHQLPMPEAMVLLNMSSLRYEKF